MKIGVCGLIRTIDSRNYSMTRYISHSYGKIILVGIWTCANDEELYVD